MPPNKDFDTIAFLSAKDWERRKYLRGPLTA
jgi:hypothetical protein